MLNILKATTSKAPRILLFLVLTGNLASGQFAFEYYSRCTDAAPWEMENGDQEREIDPRYNLDRLTPDEKLGYCAVKESFEILYRGARPKNVSMSTYWQQTSNRMLRRTTGTKLFSLNSFWITRIRIIQVLYNTVFIHVCGWTTFPVGPMNAISMDWDVGFENLRVLPKLTVFWETSAHESDAELQKIRDQGHF
jgi:hypothetical protein